MIVTQQQLPYPPNLIRIVLQSSYWRKTASRRRNGHPHIHADLYINGKLKECDDFERFPVDEDIHRSGEQNYEIPNLYVVQKYMNIAKRTGARPKVAVLKTVEHVPYEVW